ncbi:ImmA/IrrE family metallo-endopeptidase [Evansella sp. AB-P1]|uniref:ImmA/IrrE family metallo-endopeptidase n=1 Tax=Evansella sp. AB-P1 TaxID=3037653 RepID=UPI00241FC9F0|nr:ImmA/IrrE family metallo-endopeptidase [Evansella sp. AB-P1]MDG5787808.1 ImmA/IrrE family metallo-endopeptidase [Evansella sp. AB-P1]
MKAIYKPTPLESWVSQRYKRMGIYNPSDLDEKRICDALGIFFKRIEKSSHSIEQGAFKLIAVNSLLTVAEQREQFYHELAHILRHSGRQSMMTSAFRELQEWDASHFTRYAAIPFHMLHQFDLNDQNIVKNLAEQFQCTPNLCHERLEKIYNNSKVV